MKIGGVPVEIEHVGLKTPVEQRPLLFRPYTIRGVTLRNRIMLGPMSQYLSEDGNTTDWHLVHLGQFALGGAGIVFAEETAVEAIGRRTHDCAGIYNDEHVRRYRRITTFLRELGAAPAIQLGHGGRRSGVRPPWQGRAPLNAEDAAKGLGPWQPVSSSAIPHAPGRRVPTALDAQGIKDEIRAWREAAARSLDAGFEIIELHGAHGYLINQFLSPVANKRTDAYGGDLEGRMRFALELVEAVREAWPKEKPLFVRVSCVDGKGGHWDIDDTVTLALALKQRGVDMIDCSSGGLTGESAMPAAPRFRPGYNLIYSEHVRREAQIPTIAIGWITEPRQAEAILQEGKADIIGLARTMMLDPYWPAHAARELGLADWLDVLPPTYAARLYPYEEERRRQSEPATEKIPFRR
jgi:2,4-dienoyl-CoA reductase-like NADH-dependent reductase (Old Yellow Enzyme family)